MRGEGRPPCGSLHGAAETGDVAHVRALLLQGADINVRIFDGTTPLQAAAAGNQAEVIALLRDSGADVDMLGFEGGTALHLAVARGNLAAVKALIAAGADPSKRNAREQTALELARAPNRATSGATPEEIAAVLDGTDGRVQDVYEGTGSVTALFIAAHVGDDRQIRRLLTEGVDADALLVDPTARRQFADAVRRATGRRIAPPSADGKTALHWACMEGRAEAARVLIEGGAKVNTKDNGGHTPLHGAATAGAPKVVGLLLSHGAFVDVRSEWGWTPLLDVANHKPCRWLDVVDQLLASGADINHQAASGLTALDLVAGDKDPADGRALIDRGAKPSLFHLIELGETEKAIAKVRGGASITATRELRGLPANPLDYALAYNRAEIATAIRARGGRIGLWRAVEQGDVETVRWYLHRGTDPNTADEHGRTILHFAASKGHLPSVRLLVQHGASVNTGERCDGTTPLDLASFGKHQDVIDYLKRHGGRCENYLRM